MAAIDSKLYILQDRHLLIVDTINNQVKKVNQPGETLLRDYGDIGDVCGVGIVSVDSKLYALLDTLYESEETRLFAIDTRDEQTIEIKQNFGLNPLVALTSVGENLYIVKNNGTIAVITTSGETIKTIDLGRKFAGNINMATTNNMIY